MPRNSNPSIKCISMDVDKAAYDYLVSRGYSLKELFNKMMFGLLNIERESDIRYQNSQKAFADLIEQDQREKEAAAAEAAAAADFAKRERENKLSHILPVFKHLLKKREGLLKLKPDDFERANDFVLKSFHNLYTDIINQYPEYSDVVISNKWVIAARLYYSRNDAYNPDTITDDIKDILL